MSEGKWCHRVLLPVAVALVMAIVAAFGVASTSVAEEGDPDVSGYLNNQTANLTVKDVEKGVTGTAYKYLEVQWNTSENVPTLPEYEFANGVTQWVRRNFSSYIKTRNNAPTEKFRTLGTSDMRDFSDKLLAAIEKNDVVFRESDSTSTASAENGSINFNLKMGGYLIKLSNGPNCVYQPIATYVRPKSKGDGKTYELEAGTVEGKAEAKSMKIASTKTVKRKDKDTVNGDGQAAYGQIGDSFIFTIKTPIPNYPDNAVNKEFIVKDQPTSGLTITTTSIKVMIEGGEELIENTNYSTKTIDPDRSNNRDMGFKVIFDKMQYEDKLAKAGKGSKKLVVTYTGTLNNKAAIMRGTKNSAHPLIPKEFYKPDTEYTSPTPADTEIHTYGVKITKIGKTGKGSYKKKIELPGAQFELRRKGEKGRTEVHVKQQEATDAGEGATTGKYVVQPDSGGGATTTITSGPNGLVQIDGLGAGTYILKEIKAPEGGYALPGKSIKIVINDSDINGVPDTAADNNLGSEPSTIAGKSVSLDDENRLVYEFVNRKANFKLPKTGAIGAAIFGVVGVALIVTSAALVIAHRRKNKRSS
ncbi:isopeptide-forming domain-containing fimbrial protein [Bifidobacterium panos]|uniref:Gram-positive pilin backbone subunit 2, Cna-B-like domain-containing protein n=1 Tax=Bifidobacterium panos TaxID=2675321 RepID=A0ABX1SVY9_9BIFI|nr:SpaA isopeptide-forming pilin-related protein [Bifidobacterium sp. DSM 109963]NMN02000.1 Gram-positive pilin backbone subunit 2, Cna-B-like domain-containing protein [Bifidobacterium sp. DSM 109963]